ncbi:MAG: DUF547 domain-containing protein [Bacteroidota bacterium]
MSINKSLFTLIISLIGVFNIQAQDIFFDKADAFFERYVQDGLVDYNAIKEDSESLNELTDWLAANAEPDATTNAGKATLINAYNLFVIKGVVDAKPIKSVQEVSSFFDRKVFQLGETKLSLNELEKQVLIKQTNDARLHFALVCAAMGCPVIINEAYRPETLDSQLDQQTAASMNSTSFTRAQGSSVQLSRIFEWYKSDFEKDRESVIDFVNSYRNEPIDSQSKISFYEYDWSLNTIAPVVKPKKSKSTSNLLQFTPSQLFRRGQYEVNIFNNLYSQTSVWDRDGNEISQDRRLNILTTNIQFTYGISNNARVNIGADLVLSNGSVGLTDGGQFQLLFNENIAYDFAVTAIGPRIKVAPFKKHPYFSYQTSFLFPVADDPEAQTTSRDVFLALNRYQWRNQFYLDLKLTQKFRLFYQIDANYLITRDVDEVFFQPNFLDVPTNLFINYFPTDKINLFVMGQYFSRFGNTSLADSEQQVKFGLLQASVQLGAGLKYQATSRLGFELSYGDFVSGRGFETIEMGAGEVVNFGIRYIR